MYLRHMLALEDGQTLRLLEGIGNMELSDGEPYRLANSPTRFGRITLNLEPVERKNGWRLAFEKGVGPSPESVQIPESLGKRLHLKEVSGTQYERQDKKIHISPEAKSWEALWEEE